MTSTHAERPIHLGHVERVAPRARARAGDPRERTVGRVGVAATAVVLLVMAVLLVTSPETVLIPLAVVLITGVIVGGLVLMVDRRTRAPFDVPEGDRRRVRRHDAVA